MLACAGGRVSYEQEAAKGGWRTAAPSGRRWRRTHSFTDLTRKVRTLLKGSSAASAHWRGAPLRFRHGTAPPRREGAVDCPPRDGCPPSAIK